MAAIPWEIHKAEFVASAVRRSHFPQPERPEVAFAGRSNCGKSSLLNLLVRRKNLARTSNTPGLTQQINFFLINDSIYYVDLPGYGFAKVPPSVHKTWKKMIENYLTENPNLRMLILLLDARREVSALDDELVEFLEHHQIPTLPVLTKCDKLGKMAIAKAQAAIAKHFGMDEGALPVVTSALKGAGREELLKEIYEALNPAEEQPKTPREP